MYSKDIIGILIAPWLLFFSDVSSLVVRAGLLFVSSDVGICAPMVACRPLPCLRQESLRCPCSLIDSFATSLFFCLQGSRML